MAEYIDREAAKKAFWNIDAGRGCRTGETTLTPNQIVDYLDEIDAADVAPVVYCRECEYHHWEQEPCHGRTEHYCSLIHGLTTVYRDTFCSYSKRREIDGGADE